MEGVNVLPLDESSGMGLDVDVVIGVVGLVVFVTSVEVTNSSVEVIVVEVVVNNDVVSDVVKEVVVINNVVCDDAAVDVSKAVDVVVVGASTVSQMHL